VSKEASPRPADVNLDFDRFRLAASTADLDDERRARAHADLVEFRMDLADDPLAALDGYDGLLPLLVTNRAAREGGEAADDTARLDVLRTATAHDAVVAADVELAALRTDAGARTVETARDEGVRVVVSVHDFEGTPRPPTLRNVLARAARAGDVGKAAVTATGPDDALALLRATRAATRAGERVATMAMGRAGRHTRALAPVYGSRLGYAPVDPSEATAPGQYDLATLRGLVDALA
jgi:3-dehydroquinate dehydratase-1